MRRRTLLIGASVGIVGLAGAPRLGGFGRTARAQAQGGDAEITAFDRVLGDPDAPVTILEYASLTCPHCAHFHAKTLPDLKDQYLDAGKAKLVFRQFPLNQLDLRAGLLLRCAPESQYFNMANAIFGAQERWMAAPDPLSALGQIGRMVGLDQATIDACLADQAMADRIIEVAQDGQQKYGVRATPTFVIDGEVLAGDRPLADFAAAIDAAG